MSVIDYNQFKHLKHFFKSNFSDLSLLFYGVFSSNSFIIKNESPSNWFTILFSFISFLFQTEKWQIATWYNELKFSSLTSFFETSLDVYEFGSVWLLETGSYTTDHYLWDT